jgi:tetratricopeptide (TPR) repeat protein
MITLPNQDRSSADLNLIRINTSDFAHSIKDLSIPSDPKANRLFERAMDAEGGMGKMFVWLLFRKIVGTGLYSRAITLYTKALERENTCAKVHTGFGILLARVGRKQEALQHFLKANEIHPKNAWVEANLSLCYHELGDFKNASIFQDLAQSHGKVS